MGKCVLYKSILYLKIQGASSRLKNKQMILKITKFYNVKLVLCFNLIQPRNIWEEDLNGELSRLTYLGDTILTAN